MSPIQKKRCADRISDPATREKFLGMMNHADALVADASRLRLQAWADWRRATGAVKRSEKSVTPNGVTEKFVAGRYA